VVRKFLYVLASIGLLLAGPVSASQAAQAAPSAHAAQVTAATQGTARGSQASREHPEHLRHPLRLGRQLPAWVRHRLSPDPFLRGRYRDLQQPDFVRHRRERTRPGTRVYYAPLQRYFIMEDDCTECDQDWTSSGYRHIDLWAGGRAGDNANALYACEDKWTSNAQVPVIVNRQATSRSPTAARAARSSFPARTPAFDALSRLK